MEPTRWMDKIPVELPDGTAIQVEVTQTGREDVAFGIYPFQAIAQPIKSIVEAVATSLRTVSSTSVPDKATVKFGLDLAIESGQLTAVIVKGSEKSNLEITLEWNVK
ncbi:CU044_2847 family protein [Nodosilinea sp. E11]|uniref:CU044_2847 family protein n=1 Tax=Nodosilinea sp. E11 TaxID=3037479 RepID=UPI0029343579|nr:CU044_2847 family protein [Nodosilinea sp. E11]WOD39690.1 CU044_2847 family protein [Nodosilinea sp. E11]